MTARDESVSPEGMGACGVVSCEDVSHDGDE